MASEKLSVVTGKRPQKEPIQKQNLPTSLPYNDTLKEVLNLGLVDGSCVIYSNLIQYITTNSIKNEQFMIDFLQSESKNLNLTLEQLVDVCEKTHEKVEIWSNHLNGM